MKREAYPTTIPRIALEVVGIPLLALSPLSAQLPAGNWQYVWGDDFSGNTLDGTKWSYNYPWGTTHNHNATMSPNNVRFGDGALTLIAQLTGILRRDRFDPASGPRRLRSSRMDPHGAGRG